MNVGATPIHIAAYNGNLQGQNVLRLIDQFCFLGYEKVLAILIRNGANVNAVEHIGMTPLYVAAQQGYL